jgi:hypothetical protein
VTSTADLLDQHGDRAKVCLLAWRSFGGRHAFSGTVRPSAAGRAWSFTVPSATARGSPVSTSASWRWVRTHAPARTGDGDVGVPVSFGGVTFRQGETVAVDDDDDDVVLPADPA